MIGSIKNLKIYFIVLLGLLLFGCQHKPEVKPISNDESILPSTLIYQPNSKTIQYLGGGDTSVIPTVDGTQPMNFSLTSVPDHFGNIEILPTGALVFKNGLAVNTYVISVTVTNTAGAVTFPSVYTAAVVNSPTAIANLTYSSNSISLSEGNGGTSIAPTFSGTSPVTFAFTAASAVSGISIDNNGIITVANNVPIGSYQLSIEATNSVGTTTFANVYTVTVNPILVSGLLYSPNAMSLVVGSGGSSAAPSRSSGSTPITYSLAVVPSDPNITIHSTTGVITATNSLGIGTYLINVTATNAAGAQLFSSVFTINITATSTAPSAMNYSPNSLTVNQGVAGNSVSPTINGTTPISYSMSSSPANAAISINSSTGVISVSNASSPGTYTLSVDATNSAGITSFNSIYTITVTAAVAPFNLVYSTNSMTITANSSGSSVSPSISGTSPINYSLSSSPANGLISINSSTGVIAITAGSSPGTYTLTVTASNSAGSAPFNGIYTITVSAPLVSFASDIQPIITSKCNGAACHSGGQTNYSLYSNASNTGASIGINPILDRINRTQGSIGFMPKNGTKLTQTELDLFQQWLDDGLQP